MRKRRTLLVFLVFLVIMLVFVAVSKMLSYHIESAAVEAIGDYTQRKVILEGQFIFKPRLSPKISIKQITLSGKNREKKHLGLSFLQADSVEFISTWRSLFSKTPVLQAIIADNVELNIVDNGKGHTIWKMLENNTHKDFSEEDRQVLQALRYIEFQPASVNYMDKHKLFHRYQFSSMIIKHKNEQWTLEIKGLYKSKPLQLHLNGVFNEEKKQWTINAKAKILENQLQLRGIVVPSFKGVWFDGDVQTQGENFSAILLLIGHKFDRTGPYNIKTKLKIDEKSYQFSQLDAEVVNTKLTGKVDFPRKSAAQVMQAKVNINSKNAGEFFKVFGISRSFSQGNLSALADVRASVKSEKAFINSLSGHIALDIENLTYKRIKSLANQPKGEAFYRAASIGTRDQHMLLQCFVGQFRLKQGMSITPGFIFKTPAMIVEGKGSINLRNQAMDLDLKPTSVSVRIPGLPTGIHVGGTLQHPYVTATLSKGGFIPIVFGIATGGIGFVALASLDIATSAGSTSTRNNQCTDYIRSHMKR